MPLILKNLQPSPAFQWVDMSPNMLPEAAVFVALLAEVEAAAKAGRKNYLYIDLTNSHVLPLWLPPASVGARSLLPGEVDASRQLADPSQGLMYEAGFVPHAARPGSSFVRRCTGA